MPRSPCLQPNIDGVTVNNDYVVVVAILTTHGLTSTMVKSVIPSALNIFATYQVAPEPAPK
jgi:hypothetical protein